MVRRPARPASEEFGHPIKGSEQLHGPAEQQASKIAAFRALLRPIDDDGLIYHVITTAIPFRKSA